MNKSESKYFNTAKKMDKALISLLEEKSFEYITVSEICKKANVNRSTFYLHYENMVELLEETVRFILDDFISYFDIGKNNITCKFKEAPLDKLVFITDEYIHPYLLYIKDNKRVFSTVLLNAESFGFNEIYTRLYERIFNPILERFNYPVTDRKYVMKFYLNGITAIINEWLKDDCILSVEDITRIINECIFGRNNCIGGAASLI